MKLMIIHVRGKIEVDGGIISRRSSGVERFLGKEEVVGSIPIVGSKTNDK